MNLDTEKDGCGGMGEGDCPTMAYFPWNPVEGTHRTTAAGNSEEGVDIVHESCHQVRGCRTLEDAPVGILHNLFARSILEGGDVVVGEHILLLPFLTDSYYCYHCSTLDGTHYHQEILA